MKRWAEVGIGILTLTALSEFAFSRPVRKQVGNVNKWNCSTPRCKKNFWEGWLIDIHHKTPVWEGGADVIENADPKCLEHHYKFHKNRGNGEDAAAARLILGRIQSTSGGRTQKWIKEHKKK